MTEPDRTRAVERGLMPIVRIRGRDEGPWDLRERLVHHGVPGAGVAVLHRGVVEWSRGYGWADAAASVPVTEGTLFQAASISKPVTAFVVLRLVAEGVLDLDRDVNAYLRSWRLPSDERTGSQPVTLRHLLTHTAGLTVHGFPGYAMDAALPTREQILDGVPPANSAPIRVDIPVGSATRYSGGGTTIVEQVLEDVTRVPFTDLASEVVLAPLGMTSSTFEQPLLAALWPRASSAHEGGVPIAGRWHVYPEHAAAGLWTTAHDLAAFAAGVQRALGEAPGALLPARIANLMAVPHAPGGFSIGFMPESDDWKWLGHSGGNRGFACRLVLDRHGDGTAVMLNTARRSGDLIMEVINAVAHAYGWGDYLAPELVIAAIDHAAASRLAGAWQVDGIGTIVIDHEDGRLRGTFRERSEELLPLSEDAFIGATSGWTWEFVRHPDGRIDEGALRSSGLRYAAHRVGTAEAPPDR